MATGIKTIHVRRLHGKMVVQADGATPRGKRYIKTLEELECKDPRDSKFKSELAAAIDKLLPESPSPE